MNRYLKILIPFVFITTVCFGQKNRQYEIKTGPPFHIEVKVKKGDRLEVSQFNKVVFYDCRIDSSQMGYVLVDSKKTGSQQLIFEGGAQNYIQDKLQKLIVTASGQHTLHIVLKDFTFISGITQAGWLEAVMTSSQKITSNLHYNADLFVSGGGGIKSIGSIDTIFTAMRWLPENAGKLTEQMMKFTIMEGERNALLSVNQFTEEQFRAITGGAVLPPILGTDKYKKGIYFSYEQFLNNEAIDMKFDVKQEANSLSLQYKQPGDTTKDIAWGFSDGGEIYMHLDSTYYHLNRTGKIFNVRAPETVEIINTFATTATVKAMNVASLYFIYDDPFKLFSLLGFTKKLPKWKPSLQQYELNILNGKLR